MQKLCTYVHTFIVHVYVCNIPMCTVYTLPYEYVHMINLPHPMCIVVLSVSNPMILSALHLKTSPLLGFVIVIVETFPLVGSGDPLRNH